MQRTKKIIIILAGIIAGCTGLSFGTSRSTGIGFRGTLYKPNHSNGGIIIRADGPGSSATVSTPGGGGHLYFFSRLTGNWYLEASIGGMGEAEIIASYEDETIVKSSGLVPFLFGLRMDILPLRFANAFQPYLEAGPGYYMVQESNVQTEFASSNITADLQSRFGGYFGGGVNIELRDWVAFNMDAKYHQVQKIDNDDRSGSEFGFGFCFMWGRKQEIFRVVESKIIVQNIYPTYYQFYNTYPIAIVTIQNQMSYPIEVNIISEIPGISERAEESGFKRIPAHQEEDVPVYALFGEKLLRTVNRAPATLDLKIEARAGTMLTKTMSSPLVIHSRNSWDGDTRKLSYFVTTENPLVRSLAKESAIEDSADQSGRAKNLIIAQRIFDAIRKRNLRYLSDPNIPFYKDDRVQFAETTWETGTGDCDDLAVLYASLLGSVGIKTAFVDVADPEKKTAHVYLLVDMDVPPEQGYLISSNSKRYIVRKSVSGKTSCWIPVETTCVNQDFEDAWKTGATQYIQQAEMRNGLADGWVKIFDVE